MTDPECRLPPLSDFRAWLESQPWGRVIGDRGRCESCPLVVWLHSVYGGPVRVDDSAIEIEHTPGVVTVYDTPDDFMRTIFAIDYGYGGSETTEHVMVQECLYIVRDVLQEAGEE